MKRIALILFLCAFCPQPAHADTTGTLTGFVKTTAGLPVSGAVVTASSRGTISTAETDSIGFFAFVSLAPDRYEVRARRVGYDESALPGDVIIRSGLTSVVVLIMKPSPMEIGHIDRHGTELVNVNEAMLIARLSKNSYPMFYDGHVFNNALLQQAPGIYNAYGQPVNVH